MTDVSPARVRSRLRSRLTGLGVVAGMLLTGVGVAVLPASPAAATNCEFTMTSLKALNLDKDNGSRTDYVWLKIDDTWFPSGGNGIAFELSETRDADDFGDPVMGFGSSGLDIRLVLDKWPLNVTVERETFACTAVSNGLRTFSDGDAIYELRYSVTT